MLGALVGYEQKSMKYRYKILANYPNDGRNKGFGEWWVATFNCRKDAQEYIDRTVERYSKFEPKYHLEMKVVRVTEQEGLDHNIFLDNLLD